MPIYFAIAKTLRRFLHQIDGTCKGLAASLEPTDDWCWANDTKVEVHTIRRLRLAASRQMVISPSFQARWAWMTMAWCLNACSLREHFLTHQSKR